MPAVEPLSIRFELATAEDWPAIWGLMRDVIAAGDTLVFLPDMPEGEAKATWMLEGANRRLTFVARLEGEVVGTAYLKPNLPGLGDHIEVVYSAAL